ncbi:MAG: AbrB/MazE/SpoVT family DNA-binding domain-containing protein [Thaumarchaeota archaeon]|nr:AbrB/MazE/SpoVT family DNA-binding domain-containing protein [Nitrososphaerota archaeon]
MDDQATRIYARRVVKIGREPKHSLVVTIPRKICKVLQIEKGTKIYFKLDEDHFIVSKDSKFLEGYLQYMKMVTPVDSKKEKEGVIAGGISLADLQY